MLEWLLLSKKTLFVYIYTASGLCNAIQRFRGSRVPNAPTVSWDLHPVEMGLILQDVLGKGASNNICVGTNRSCDNACPPSIAFIVRSLECL